MGETSNANLLTTGSIPKKIIMFAIPLLWGNLFQQLYNVADSLIVGNFLGNNALAAVSSSGNLIFLMVGFFGGIGVGAGVVIARYFGAGESDKLKKAEYMSYHIGEEFEGIISGVTGWGFYVELPNTVEGLVHVNTLRDDYYTFDQDAYELIGDVTHKVFALGQKVRVRVADADTMLKTVDFVLAEEQEW